VAVNHLAHLFEFPPGWRWLTVFLFAVNPLMLIFAINGMSEAISVAMLVAGCYWLVRFWQTDGNSHLIMAAGFFGLLPLIRYELALVTAMSGLVLLVLCWQKRANFTEVQFRDFLEGRLLAYSSLAIYPSFLWSVSSWFVMGNPLYFLFNERSAVSLADIQISAFKDLATGPWQSFRLVFGVWSAAYLVGTIACIVALVIAWRRRVSFLAMLVLMALTLPILQFFLLMQRANVPLLRYFILAVPFGLVVAIAVIGYWLTEIKPAARQKTLAFAGLSALMLVSNVGTGALLVGYPYQTIESETWRALTSTAQVENPNFEEAYAIGQLLPKVIPSGSRVLIDTYEFGYAIMLGTGSHSLYMDFTDPNYDAAVINPSGYVDYVIVPRTVDRGIYYSINFQHKKLHDEGASWAELMDVLPQTNQEWKLYKVKR
jgi:hypothetical protein